MTIDSIRTNRREQIINFFLDTLGIEHGSGKMHSMFGSSFRLRVSEINRDQDAPVTIKNHYRKLKYNEASTYTARLRGIERDEGEA